ncbi:uncharacterized protein TNCV_2606631 [Trichonephila clavipes]|uniref:Uncharacterized protein n=1 Tax=Trichonephila clavipes TaxID=2585209 RepID=A0A8X6S3S5_TRICX|nr:uncharacterized protein TNCV_2606631 [Trichonephila clavipes]
MLKISSFHNSTGLAIETSCHTGRFHLIGCCDDMVTNKLRQFQVHRFTVLSAHSVEFVQAPSLWQTCIVVKDEDEKLAYQLNEEAERTERPIRRLSKVMYGSTCADMQVDIMGECLSSIKHVVGVTSVFLAKGLHAV